MENNKPAFTPGPWVPNTVVHDKGQFTSIEAPNAKPYSHDIATVYCSDYPEQAANANLLSAALDLYEALEAVIRVADRKTVEFDMAHAALAKARGEVAP